MNLKPVREPSNLHGSHKLVHGAGWENGQLVATEDPNQPDEIPATLSEQDCDRLAKPLGRILEFIFRDMARESRKKKQGRSLDVRTRGYAVMWLLSPKSFNNCTQRAISKRFGISPVRFCECIKQFQAEFNYRPDGSKPPEAGEKMRQAAIRRHRKQELEVSLAE